ncbi:hypothetical protein D3C87_1786350 [compost metagenome]
MRSGLQEVIDCGTAAVHFKAGLADQRIALHTAGPYEGIGNNLLAILQINYIVGNIRNRKAGQEGYTAGSQARYCTLDQVIRQHRKDFRTCFYQH